MLLAAAGVQDATAAVEAAAPVKDDKPAAAAADAPVATIDPMLMLPLPPAAPTVAQPTVTIVATEKRPADAHEPVAIASISSRGTAAAAAAMPATMPLPAHLTDAAAALPIHALTSRPTPDASAHAAPDTRATAVPPLAEAPRDAAKADPAPARATLTNFGTLTLVATADKTAAPKPAQDVPLTAVNAASAPAAPLAAPQPIVIETVSAPAFTPGWQDETVSKLAHIVLTRNERAELKLNPAELGPVNIRVEMHAGDQASIVIVAASPETRSALEQSLPQLRDLLSTQGITLGQASVHDGSAQRDPAPAARASDRPGNDGSPAPRDNVIQLAARRADRLVDVFA